MKYNFDFFISSTEIGSIIFFCFFFQPLPQLHKINTLSFVVCKIFVCSSSWIVYQGFFFDFFVSLSNFFCSQEIKRYCYNLYIFISFLLIDFLLKLCSEVKKERENKKYIGNHIGFIVLPIICDLTFTTHDQFQKICAVEQTYFSRHNK